MPKIMPRSEERARHDERVGGWTHEVSEFGIGVQALVVEQRVCENTRHEVGHGVRDDGLGDDGARGHFNVCTHGH